MEEKEKLPFIRFLHPENELFMAGKNRFVAQPDEVKHNIMLQVKYGLWGSGWSYIVAFVIFVLGIGFCVFLCATVYMLYTYVVYLRPMNVNALYGFFKRDNTTRVQVNAIIPLDAPYVHISYMVENDEGMSFEERYLTTLPVNLEVGDSVYMASTEYASIIL